jgi:hypothetical protein
MTAFHPIRQLGVGVVVALVGISDLLGQTAAAPAMPAPAGAATASAGPGEDPCESPTTCRAVLADLKSRADASEKVAKGLLPDRFTTVHQEWVSDDTAVITAVLNRRGSMRIRIYSDTGTNRRLPLRTFDSKDKVTHHVHFSSLEPKSSYKVEITILNVQNTDTRMKVTSDEYPDLAFTTDNQISTPELTAAKPVVQHDQASIRLTATEEVVVHLRCNLFPKDSIVPKLVDSSGNEFAEDELFRPTGGLRIEKGASRDFTCKLAPEGEYSIEWSARSTRTGRSIEIPRGTFPKFTTPAAPVPFDFENELSLVITPASVELSWDATSQPDDASAELVLNDGSDGKTKLETKSTIKVVDVVKGDVVEHHAKVTLSIPMVSLVASQRATDNPLKLRALMNKGTVVRKIAISVKVDLSKRENLQKDQAEALDRITSAQKTKGDGKKARTITWSDLAETGLGLLLKVL